jgi:hypothetical protein
MLQLLPYAAITSLLVNGDTPKLVNKLGQTLAISRTSYCSINFFIYDSLQFCFLT